MTEQPPISLWPGSELGSATVFAGGTAVFAGPAVLTSMGPVRAIMTHIGVSRGEGLDGGG